MKTQIAAVEAEMRRKGYKETTTGDGRKWFDFPDGRGGGTTEFAVADFMRCFPYHQPPPTPQGKAVVGSELSLWSLSFGRDLGMAKAEREFDFTDSLVRRTENLESFVDQCRQDGLKVYSEGNFRSSDELVRNAIFHPKLVAFAGDNLPQGFKVLWKGCLCTFIKVLGVEGRDIVLDFEEDAKSLAAEARSLGCCY